MLPNNTKQGTISNNKPLATAGQEPGSPLSETRTYKNGPAFGVMASDGTGFMVQGGNPALDPDPARACLFIRLQDAADMAAYMAKVCNKPMSPVRIETIHTVYVLPEGECRP